MAKKKRPVAKKKRRANPAASRDLSAPKAKRVKAGATTGRGNDDVLVAFEHGATRAPYITGNLWSGSDRPPRKPASRAAHCRPGRTSDSECVSRNRLTPRRGRGRAVRASRCRCSNAGLGERAANDSADRNPAPSGGWGARSEPSPE